MIEISTLVRNQFPDFVKSEGDGLITFVEAYYEWMEQSESIRSNQLLSLRDIDTTVDEFIVHFKDKYLSGLPTLTRGDLREFIKHSKDLYEAKGTEKSVQLLMRLLFGTESEVYTPGTDTLRASAGRWHKPVYLEVTAEPINKSFEGQEIIGATSGARAIVERCVRRITNGIYYDVLYITSVVGSFKSNERITSDGTLDNVPTVIGSMNEIQITNGGQDNNIGDVFNIFSTNGKQGRARVVEAENGTGRIEFKLLDGGTGYTMFADTIVSDIMFVTASQTGSGFRRFETIKQRLNLLDYVSGNGAFIVGDTVEGYTSGTWIKQAEGTVINIDPSATAANGALTVQVTTGDFRIADALRKSGNTIGAVIDTSADVSASANLVGANSTHLGIHDITNTFRIVGGITAVRGLRSNTTAIIESRGSGQEGDFSIGSLENEETVFINTDFWHQNNSANVPYLEVFVDASGSGVGFVDKVSIGKELTISNTAHTFAVDDICYQSYANNVVYARGIIASANTTKIVAYENLGTFDTTFPLRKADTNTPVTSILSLGGTGYANGNVVTFTNGGRTITSITVTNGGTGYANGQHVVVVGDAEDDDVLITLITNGAGTIVTTNVVESKTFKFTPVLTVANTSGTGAVLTPSLNNPTPATGTVITDGTGKLVGVSMAYQGAGYYSQAKVNVPTGSGANVFASMDYGYGLPKNIHGDLFSVINDTLFYDTIVAGTISSLTRIFPGEQYSIDPFVAVAEDNVSGLDRRDFKLTLSNTNGAFVTGELVEQDIITPATELVYTLTGIDPFELNEVVQLGDARGQVYFANSTILRLTNTVGEFPETGTVTGLFSEAVGTVTDMAPITLLATAKGQVRSANTSTMIVKRTSINTSFKMNAVIKGRRSGANSSIVGLTYDYTNEAMGNNAVVTANVKTANGIATVLDVIDSGFGYGPDEPLELVNPDSPYAISGRAVLKRQGIGEGFWTSTAGFLNNDQHLHDGRYYQAFSYEVQTNLSLDRYSDVLKKIVHVSGTELFGRVIYNPNIETDIDTSTKIVQEYDGIELPENGSILDFGSSVNSALIGFF